MKGQLPEDLEVVEEVEVVEESDILLNNIIIDIYSYL